MIEHIRNCIGGNVMVMQSPARSRMAALPAPDKKQVLPPKEDVTIQRGRDDQRLTMKQIQELAEKASKQGHHVLAQNIDRAVQQHVGPIEARRRGEQLTTAMANERVQAHGHDVVRRYQAQAISALTDELPIMGRLLCWLGIDRYKYRVIEVSYAAYTGQVPYEAIKLADKIFDAAPEAAFSIECITLDGKEQDICHFFKVEFGDQHYYFAGWHAAIHDEQTF